MKYIEGFNRNQAILFPQCIDEIIPEDSEVRIIDAFVDALPLKDLGFLEHQPSEEGRPMYHPKDLFKLYVYGYLNRIRTSRLLERECERNIELIWFLKGLRPVFSPLQDFDQKTLKLFAILFAILSHGLTKVPFWEEKLSRLMVPSSVLLIPKRIISIKRK